MTDRAALEKIIQDFFHAFHPEGLALVHQKVLSREDCQNLISSFARIAADKHLALIEPLAVLRLVLRALAQERP